MSSINGNENKQGIDTNDEIELHEYKRNRVASNQVEPIPSDLNLE